METSQRQSAQVSYRREDDNGKRRLQQPKACLGSDFQVLFLRAKGWI